MQFGGLKTILNHQTEHKNLRYASNIQKKMICCNKSRLKNNKIILFSIKIAFK